MAAPTFVGAGAGVTIASGSGAVTAAGSGVAVGDLIVLQVLQDGVVADTVSYSAVSGIANLFGTASSLTTLALNQPCGTLARQSLWVGRATSTTCSVTVATIGDDLYYRVYVFRDVAVGPSTTVVDCADTYNSPSNISGDGGTTEQSAQSFLAPQGTLVEVRASLLKSGTPFDNVIFEIQTDSAGAPSGTVVGTVASQAAAALTASSVSRAYICSVVIPTAGTYWLVARRSGARDTVNRAQWAGNTAGTYANGFASGRSSGAWTAVPATDRLFGVTFGAALPDIIENGTAGSFVNGSGSGTSVADTGVVTLGADRIALQFVGLDDDVAIAAFTGMTGGTWVEAVAEFASATGTDGCIQLQRATMATAGTINGGATAIVTAGWGVIGFALKPVAAAGPATLERSAALALVGLIATIGRELLARTAVLNATGLVASSGARVVPATERSAALTVTGLIQSSGISVVKASAALNATGLIATAGQVVHVRARSAALNATGLIATAGRELLPRTAALTATGSVSASGVKVGGAATLERSAALTATGSISSVGRETLSRSAALTASGLIASAGRELLPRLVRVDATGLIASRGQRRLHRQTTLAATGQINTIGQIEGGAATVERSAALTATGSITSARLRVHVRLAALAGTGTVTTAYRRRLQRAALVTATGTVTVAYKRSWSSSAALNATGAVAATPQRLLLRSAALNATGSIELTAGLPTAQFSFDAVATITTSIPWHAGAISTPTTGFIYGAYLGAIQQGSNGQIATGTDGQLARTGG